jgi:hypothetical protein
MILYALNAEGYKMKLLILTMLDAKSFPCSSLVSRIE